MFNKFYNYITGLINNRFVFQKEAGEAAKAAAQEAQAKAAEDQEITREATKEAYAEYAEKTGEEAEKAAEAGKVKPKGPVDYSKQDKYRKVEHYTSTVTGKLEPVRAPQEVAAVKPVEPKDEILEKAKTLAAKDEAEQELAALGVEGKKKPDAELAQAAKTAEETETEDIYKIALKDLKQQIENKDYDLNSFAKNLGKVASEISAALATEGALTEAAIDNIMKNKAGQEAGDAEIIIDIAKHLGFVTGKTPDEVSQAIYNNLVENGVLTGTRKAYFDKVARNKWLPNLNREQSEMVYEDEGDMPKKAPQMRDEETERMARG